jgi:AcrR family transcriptional regulator
MDLSNGLMAAILKRLTGRAQSMKLTSRYTFDRDTQGRMGRSALQTRQRILESAYELFYRNGFARVGVDVIAAGAGVTKRTLYYHFASKDALLASVLELHHELALARIRKWGEARTGDLETLLDSLFADLARWAAKPRWSGTGFTRIAMELADLPGHPARAIASRHKAVVESWLADEFARRGVVAPGLRAREVQMLLEGSVSLMLIHGDRSIAGAAAEAAKRLLRSP